MLPGRGTLGLTFSSGCQWSPGNHRVTSPGQSRGCLEPESRAHSRSHSWAPGGWGWRGRELRGVGTLCGTALGSGLETPGGLGASQPPSAPDLGVSLRL